MEENNNEEPKQTGGRGKIKPRFKKGQSGNPNGRPKGIRNRSTLAKQWLEVSEKVKNPITGEIEELEQQDIMTLALIKKARSGDVAAYKELMDSAYGKAVMNIDHKTDGQALPPAQNTLQVNIVPPQNDEGE